MVSIVKTMHEYWREIVLASLVALIVVATVSMIASGSAHKAETVALIKSEIDKIDLRLQKIEASAHPATSKRYNSDMAAKDKADVMDAINKVDERLTEHLIDESNERVAHDIKCKQRWDSVGKLKAEIERLKSGSTPAP